MMAMFFLAAFALLALGIDALPPEKFSSGMEMFPLEANEKMLVNMRDKQNSFSCSELQRQFLVALQTILQQFQNLAYGTWLTCASSDCYLTTDVSLAMKRIKALLPQLQSCGEQQEICAQLAGLKYLLKSESGKLLSFLLGKIGPDFVKIKQTLAENALIQYGAAVSPPLSDAFQKICRVQ